MEKPIECSDGDFLWNVFPHKGVFREQQLDEIAVRVGAVASARKLTEDGKEEAENGRVMRKISKVVLEASSKLGSKLVLGNRKLVFQKIDRFS